jgi:hypothetical protein
MDIKKVRVERLKALIEQLGGAANVARNYDDINPSYLSQLINEFRPFGEKSARNLEKKLSLSSNYFDQIFSEAEFNILEQPQLNPKQTTDEYAPLIIQGKEMLPNEVALINMYKKLKFENQAIIDGLTNQLYA